VGERTVRRRRGALARLAAVLVLTGAAPAVAASSVAASGAEPAGAKLVRSMIEIRDQQVVRQQWDLTCGAAAIATLLTYQLGRPVTERQVVAALLHRVSPAIVRARLGFSLLDLKVYAATQGLAAAAFDGMSLDDLDAMAPAIVPIRPHGFRHVVVYRGLIGDRVMIADPTFGNRTLPAQAFQARWAGAVGFVVFDPADQHPPNRIGPSPRLQLTPASAALRAGLMARRPGIAFMGAGQ
jgi:predicted double-glycine peptidase